MKLTNSDLILAYESAIEEGYSLKDIACRTGYRNVLNDKKKTVIPDVEKFLNALNDAQKKHLSSSKVVMLSDHKSNHQAVEVQSV